MRNIRVPKLLLIIIGAAVIWIAAGGQIVALLMKLDNHPGLTSLIGFLVTIWIFSRQLSNSYYTMERDTFNDLFREIVSKELPEKIRALTNAGTDGEWDAGFKSLRETLSRVKENAGAFTYSMPFFCKALSLIIDEIVDLARYAKAEEWKICREKTEQNDLIISKCSLLITTIFDVSKGKVWRTKWFASKPYQTVRKRLYKEFFIRPADEIMNMYAAGTDFGSKFDYYTANESGSILTGIDSLTDLESSSIRIEPAQGGIHIDGIHCVQHGKQVYFGYRHPLLWKSQRENTVIKTKTDSSVHTEVKAESAVAVWNDSDFHDIVITWREDNDHYRVHFCSFQVRCSHAAARK